MIDCRRTRGGMHKIAQIACIPHAQLPRLRVGGAGDGKNGARHQFRVIMPGLWRDHERCLRNTLAGNDFGSWTGNVSSRHPGSPVDHLRCDVATRGAPPGRVNRVEAPRPTRSWTRSAALLMRRVLLLEMVVEPRLDLALIRRFRAFRETVIAAGMPSVVILPCVRSAGRDPVRRPFDRERVINPDGDRPSEHLQRVIGQPEVTEGVFPPHLIEHCAVEQRDLL